MLACVRPSSGSVARMWMGRFMKRRASATIGPGIVAEKSMVCRIGRRLREELLDVGEEAEVEHLVGLVEHHLLDVLEREQALVGEVEQAAGGADDDLRAGLELLDLALVGLAAVDGDDLGGAVGAASSRSSATCTHSSRVGTTMSALTPGSGSVPRPGCTGRPKPKVLPVPVLAWPMMSWPGEAEGDGLLLDGEGSTIPSAASASTMSWSMERSENVTRSDALSSRWNGYAHFFHRAHSPRQNRGTAASLPALAAPRLRGGCWWRVGMLP